MSGGAAFSQVVLLCEITFSLRARLITSKCFVRNRLGLALSSRSRVKDPAGAAAIVGPGPSGAHSGALFEQPEKRSTRPSDI